MDELPGSERSLINPSWKSGLILSRCLLEKFRTGALTVVKTIGMELMISY